jgi:WD40 repeat protein
VQLWELAGKAPAARTVVNLDDATPVERPCFQHVEAIHGLVALTPDGQALVAAPNGGPLRRYDLTGQAPVERPAAPEADFVRWAALLPDGERLVTLGRDGGVRLWDLGGDRPALLSRTPSPKRVGWFRPHLTPDGRTLVLSVGGSYQPYPLWVLRLGDGPLTECALLEGPRATRSAWLTTAGNLVVVKVDDRLDVWDVSGGRPRKRPDLAAVGDRLLKEEMALAPDGRTVALCDEGGPVWITDQHGKAPRTRYALPEALGLLPPWAFAPDGTRLALSVHLLSFLGQPYRGPDSRFTSTLTLWDLKGEQPRKCATLEHWPGEVAGVAFAPDGRLVLSTAGDRVIVWDAADGRKLREWQVPGGVDSAAFAPDGRHLVALTLTGAAYVLRLSPGRESPDPKVAARARVLRARRELRQNRVPEALATLKEAVGLDPACAEAHYTLALTHLRAKDPDQALADLNRVIEMDGRHAPAYYRRGLLYADRNEFGRARADLNRAAALDPTLGQRRP